MGIDIGCLQLTQTYAYLGLCVMYATLSKPHRSKSRSGINMFTCHVYKERGITSRRCTTTK